MKTSKLIALFCTTILATASLTGITKASEKITPRDCIGEGCGGGSNLIIVPSSATFYGTKNITISKQNTNHTSMTISIHELDNCYVQINGKNFNSTGTYYFSVSKNEQYVDAYASSYSSNYATYSLSGYTEE